MSTSLVLPCRSRCIVVGIAVDVLICAWGWCLICQLPWTPISVVPTLTTTETRSHNTSVLCIIVSLLWRWCRSRRLEVGALNLSLRCLKSLACACTLGCPLYCTGWNTGPHDDEPTRNLVLLPCDPVRCIFLFRSTIPLRFSRTKSLVHHVLKIDEVTGFKRIGKTIIRPVEKPVLLLLVCIHVIRSLIG
jgi:hypothetical protein